MTGTGEVAVEHEDCFADCTSYNGQIFIRNSAYGAYQVYHGEEDEDVEVVEPAEAVEPAVGRGCVQALYTETVTANPPVTSTITSFM